MTSTSKPVRPAAQCAEEPSGFAPLAGVPAYDTPSHRCLRHAGTPDPLRSRGGEFNKLAPQVPEGLDAPSLTGCRQRRCPRGPPSLRSMARQG